MFVRLIEYLEEQGLDTDAGLKARVQREYTDSLYDAYVSGTVYQREEYDRWHRSHEWLREISDTLLWREQESEKTAGSGNRLLQYGIKLVHPVELTEQELRTAREERKERQAVQQSVVRPVFDQLWEPTVRFRIEEMEGQSRRYFDLRVKLERLMEIDGRGFSLTGSPERQLKLLFYGKCYLTAYPDKTFQEDHRMILGTIPDASFKERELNEALHHIDEALCFELIEAGRIGAGPYAERFNEAETRRLLEASLALGNAENAAILLEREKSFRKGDCDLELDF